MKLARPPVLQLTIGERSARAEATQGDVTLWAGEAGYESPSDLAEVIARLAAAPSQRCRRLRVTLEKPPAQTRTLTDLPPARHCAAGYCGLQRVDPRRCALWCAAVDGTTRHRRGVGGGGCAAGGLA